MRNLPEQFKLYPRGFIGQALGPRLSKVAQPVEGNNGFHKEVVSVVRSQNDIGSPNLDIDMLHSQWVRRTGDWNTFAFRKRVLTQAVRSFGTKNFQEWYMLQAKSVMIGDNHLDFMRDILQFISTGRRQLMIDNWDILIIADQQDPKSLELTKIERDFFGISTSGSQTYPQNQNIFDVLQSWCSQPGGFEDLLCTLHVLFGKP